MTPEFETLPDVLGALEDELRARAVPDDPVVLRAPAGWRRPVAGLALALTCAVAILIIPGSVGRDGSTAYGEIPLLRTRPGPVPEELRGSPTVKAIAGRGAEVTEAWAFDLEQGTGYLLRGRDVWCIAVLYPTIGSRPVERSIKCVTTLRYGMWTSRDGTYVLALPAGVPNPSIAHPDGTTSRMHPNAQGIATTTVEHGAVISLHGADGSSIDLPPARGS